MYSLIVPDALIRRLYRLREQHQRGSIRSQILTAVERYLDETEAQLAGDQPPPSSTTYPGSSRTSRTRNGAIR